MCAKTENKNKGSLKSEGHLISGRENYRFGTMLLHLAEMSESSVDFTLPLTFKWAFV